MKPSEIIKQIIKMEKDMSTTGKGWEVIRRLKDSPEKEEHLKQLYKTLDRTLGY